jgi:hypothetical protein
MSAVRLTSFNMPNLQVAHLVNRATAPADEAGTQSLAGKGHTH